MFSICSYSFTNFSLLFLYKKIVEEQNLVVENMDTEKVWMTDNVSFGCIPYRQWNFLLLYSSTHLIPKGRSWYDSSKVSFRKSDNMDLEITLRGGWLM